MKMQTVTLLTITGMIWCLTEQADGEKVYCPSRGNALQTDYWIRINCPPISSSSEVLVQAKESFQCSSFNQTYFHGFFPFTLDTILKNSINFTAILTFYPKSCIDTLKHVQLNFYMVTGIQRAFRLAAFDMHVKWLTIQYFHMRLLENEHDKANCSNNLDVAIFQVKDPMSVTLDLGVKYDDNICAQMFNKANIRILKLADMVDSMIKRNVFGIQQTDAVKDLNSHVGVLYLYGYGLKLEQRLFPVEVFSKTKMIRLEGTLERFDSRILVSSNLVKIEIFSWHMKKFLHNNLDWLDFANERSSNETLRIILNGADLRPMEEGKIHYYHRADNQYEKLYQLDPDYADLFKDNSSFCLFYRLKQKNLNVRLNGFMFEIGAHHHCDCTLYWVYLTFINSQEDVVYYTHLVECRRHSTALQRECDIPAMAARCDLQTIQPISEPNGYTFVWKIKLTEFILTTVMASAINCFAVLFNLFVILVFRRMWTSEEFRKKKLIDKSQPLWDYVYFNVYFVLFQALIFALEPLTACIEYDGIYCSPFILTRFAQAFYLFVQSYLGNVLKLMTNVTSTLFVIYRFGINSDRLAKFRKTRPVRMIVISLVPALVISAITLFVDERFDYKILFEDKFEYLQRDRYKIRLRSPILYATYLFNILLGSIVFTVINLIIDIRLLCFLRSFKQSSRKEEAEKRVTKMIVLNGLFSFLFRMPEMAVSILFFAFTFNPFLFPSCLLSYEPTHSACPSLLKISRYFFSFTFFENFILLFLYNPDFKTQTRLCFKSLFIFVKTRFCIKHEPV
nr:G protein-coupled receptor [Proales similis]